jgi:hypothetical protein
VELGDPDCVWVAGGPNPTGPAVSHPGIVDEPKSSAVTGIATLLLRQWMKSS